MSIFCTFASSSTRFGIYRSPRSGREEIVNYQTKNSKNSEGQYLEYFAGLHWLQYLNSMARTGTYGDHITLQTSSDLCNIELQIISLRNGAHALI